MEGSTTSTCVWGHEGSAVMSSTWERNGKLVAWSASWVDPASTREPTSTCRPLMCSSLTSQSGAASGEMTTKLSSWTQYSR